MTDEIHPAPTSSTGLAPNVAGALSYLLGPITGVLFLVLEKRDGFVRFHAAQSIGISVAWIILWTVFMTIGAILGAVPFIGWIFSLILILVSLMVSLGGLILWLFLMFQAFQGRTWEFPWIGPRSRKMLLQGDAP